MHYLQFDNNYLLAQIESHTVPSLTSQRGTKQHTKNVIGKDRRNMNIRKGIQHDSLKINIRD